MNKLLGRSLVLMVAGGRGVGGGDVPRLCRYYYQPRSLVTRNSSSLAGLKNLGGEDTGWLRRMYVFGSALVFMGVGGAVLAGRKRDEVDEKLESDRRRSMHGTVYAEAEQQENQAKESKVALSTSEFRPFVLERVEKVSPNTKLYRFALPSKEHETGLTVASCLVARAEIDGKPVTRPYTPVSLNHQKGHVDLMIKTYPKPGGVMSRHCDQLRPGDSLEMKGPFKKIEYKANMKRKIGMVAGGTGITPMLQVIREILGNPEDKTEVSLIFANVTEQDILLRDELDALQYLYPSFKVFYTLDKPPSGWKQGRGFVSKEMIKEFMPKPGNGGEDILILVCGPKGFMAHVSGTKGPKYTQGALKGLLADLGYQPHQVYKF